jgi:hypothetical protein
VLKERRARDDDCESSCSSWSCVGIGIGLVEVNERGSEPMMLWKD